MTFASIQLKQQRYRELSFADLMKDKTAAAVRLAFLFTISSETLNN